MNYVKAPDFPTGGIIYGVSGVKEGFRTGRGRVVVRAKTEIETDDKGRESIIVTEVPYQVNKALLTSSSNSVSKSSSAAPSTNCAKPKSAPIFWKACSLRSTISTRLLR